MARVTAHTPVPVVYGYTLELTKEEAEALCTVLVKVAVDGPGNQTYEIFKALADAKVSYKQLSPVLGHFGDLVYFKKE